MESTTPLRGDDMLNCKIACGLIDGNPENARKVFDETALAELGISLKHGQRVPCIVFASGDRFTLVDGERRWRAASMAGIDDLDCLVLEKPPNKGELLLTQLAIDAHKAHLTPMERARLYDAVMRENNLTAAQLSAREGISQATITRYLAALKCPPDVQDALQEGKLGVSECYEISKCPPEAQAEALRVKLGGASRETLVKHIRGRKPGTSEARVGRISCPLRSGLAVVVMGTRLSLDDLIDALGEAQKEAKRARDQGLDAKTFQAVMRDKAKAVATDALPPQAGA